MNTGRYIIEFGLGLDFHGQDVTNACIKAVKDATSKSCLCGLLEILDIQDLDEKVVIDLTLAVTKPDEVDSKKVATYLPVGKVNVKTIQGGMKAPGIFLAKFNDKDESIEVALACIEVNILD